MGMQNPGMGYGMMPMYPMYGQYGMQPDMIGTGYGMNPGMQFQRPRILVIKKNIVPCTVIISRASQFYLYWWFLPH